jgi:hypothetical protein
VRQRRDAGGIELRKTDPHGEIHRHRCTVDVAPRRQGARHDELRQPEVRGLSRRLLKLCGETRQFAHIVMEIGRDDGCAHAPTRPECTRSRGDHARRMLRVEAEPLSDPRHEPDGRNPAKLLEAARIDRGSSRGCALRSAMRRRQQRKQRARARGEVHVQVLSHGGRGRALVRSRWLRHALQTRADRA